MDNHNFSSLSSIINFFNHHFYTPKNSSSDFASVLDCNKLVKEFDILLNDKNFSVQNIKDIFNRKPDIQWNSDTRDLIALSNSGKKPEIPILFFNILPFIGDEYFLSPIHSDLYLFFPDMFSFILFFYFQKTAFNAIYQKTEAECTIYFFILISGDNSFVFQARNSGISGDKVIYFGNKNSLSTFFYRNFDETASLNHKLFYQKTSSFLPNIWEYNGFSDKFPFLTSWTKTTFKNQNIYFTETIKRTIQIIKMKNLSCRSTAVQSKQWFANLNKNLNILQNKAKKIYTFKTDSRNFILIGASPMLHLFFNTKNNNINYSSGTQKSPLIFSVPSSYNFLTKNSITPDFIINFDGTYFTNFHFNFRTQFNLITSFYSHPHIIANDSTTLFPVHMNTPFDRILFRNLSPLRSNYHGTTINMTLELINNLLNTIPSATGKNKGKCYVLGSDYSNYNHLSHHTYYPLYSLVLKNSFYLSPLLNWESKIYHHSLNKYKVYKDDYSILRQNFKKMLEIHNISNKEAFSLLQKELFPMFSNKKNDGPKHFNTTCSLESKEEMDRKTFSSNIQELKTLFKKINKTLLNSGPSFSIPYPKSTEEYFLIKEVFFREIYESLTVNSPIQWNKMKIPEL